MRQSAVAAGVAVMALAAAGCQSGKPAARTTPIPQVSVASSPPATPSKAPHKKKRVHLTSSVAIPAAPAFSYRTAPVTRAELGRSWHSGCPVGPSSLRAVTMTFWGFDNIAHHGTLVVNSAVVSPVVTAFRSMYDAHFP